MNRPALTFNEILGQARCYALDRYAPGEGDAMEMLQGLAQGLIQALTRNRLEPGLTRVYARRHCQVSDVDDAVQESLMVISRKVHGLKAAAAFSSWLFTVIRRECRKLERAMFRHEPLDEDLAEHQLASKSDNDLRIDLAAALESLPAHYLEVVLLRDFEELTIAEIAKRLGEQPGAVKSRLHRARELVREYMLGPDASDKKRPIEP